MSNCIFKSIHEVIVQRIARFSSYKRAAILTLLLLSYVMPVWGSTSGRQTVLLSGEDWLINSGPTLPSDSSWVMATVPGNIQSDLEKQHLLTPFSYGAGDPNFHEVCQKEWWYKKSFVAPSDFFRKRVVIVFDGVDWSCQVWLNGQLIGQNAGMFRRFECDVTNVILPGKNNTLVLKLDKIPDELLPYIIGSDGKCSGANPDGTVSEYYFLNGMNKTRQVLKDLKAPTNFSYDWGTNIWTLGIWKDVRVEATGPARIEWAHVYSELSDNFKKANVCVKLEVNSIKNIGAAKAKFRLTGNGIDIQKITDITIADGNSVVSGQIELTKPALWWPNGYGDQPLYIVESSLQKADGTVIDTETTRFGIRDIKWGQVEGAPADFISPFMLYINGQPIRMFGCALFPDLLHGSTMKSGPKLMQLAHDGNINTLRLNGGGGVLHKGMFDLADELGIMMIEEFPIGNCLPESDEVFIKNLEVTARNIIKQVRNHPSIVEWGGGNEMSWSQGMDHPALHVFERAATEEDDSNRIFRATCPITGGRHGRYWYDPSNYDFYNDPNITEHWGPGQMMRQGEYCTETPANIEVWHRDIPPQSQWPISLAISGDDPVIIRKNILNGVGPVAWLGKEVIESLFGELKSLEELINGGQFVGAEGIRSATDALRRRGSRLGGIMTHVLNDPWPNGAGGFHIGYDGVPLMNYYWLAEALEPISIALKYNSITYNRKEGLDVELWVVSDLPKKSGPFIWKYTVRTSDGKVAGQNSGKLKKIIPQECLKVEDIHINPPANLGPVLVELQLCDGSNKIVTERVHVFGLQGGGSLGGLLKNSSNDQASYDVSDEKPLAPTSSMNFAYVGNGAKPATAVSNLTEEHIAEFINDGNYGNGSTWISSTPRPFFEIDLGQVRTVGLFKIGRDRTGQFNDRPLDFIKIETSLDTQTWTIHFERTGMQIVAGYSPLHTLEIAIQPADARYVRVTIDNGGVDEFEICPPKLPLPGLLPIARVAGFPSSVPIERTNLTATMKVLPVVDGMEATKIIITNTGEMTALFCKLQPVLVYRTDLFLDKNFITIPPKESREIIVKAPVNPLCGLKLSQTGWRVSCWNSDDAVIDAYDDVLLAFGRADSMCREYKGYSDANDFLGQYTVTLSGHRPDASLIPWIVTSQSKLRSIINISKITQGATLYIDTADQSKSVAASVIVSVNGKRFTSLLPTGLGMQNTVPYHLGYPYTVKIDIPADVLKKGENLIEILSGTGWFTWDSCYLVARNYK